MSASYSSTIMVGVRLSDVLKIDRITSEITKYDPDTGRPYQKQVSEKKFLLCDREIPDEPDDLDEFSNWIKEYFPGFSAANTGNNAYEEAKNDDYNGWAIGLTLINNEPAELTGLSFEKVQTAVVKAKEILAKAGYKGEPKLYLVHYVGYKLRA